ncbi:beta-carotene 15,15'-monooxygenase [Lysinibacillus macroides]|uniref:Beta-carotene 15,15'-monooxygenase n=1 Tax=Lysinibacillus macroides TaxID=33935 RepID=A0A0N0UWT4_9BACI|nr:hypothetical protein [Lysinibacillus macroides]KOY82035.1 beta-carotene 15,15'-monooxygenase [Lysinibacillus macroides]QPR67237.1 beta-carotene 15,15'-monooxygenase [Lysinibacillus macroides]
MSWIEKSKPIWLILVIFVLSGNYMLYQTSLGINLLPDEAQAVVLGSLLDLMICFPLFMILYRNKFSLKALIALVAFGCILLRLIVPTELLAPYAMITWSGIVVEGCLVLVECLLIVTLLRYMPKIIHDVKENQLPTLFAFSQAVGKYVKQHPIIQVICSEMLVLYYAFGSWRQAVPKGLTLYKKSNYMAFQIMIIHAIIVETIGIHYWLHTKAPIVSIVLLIFNIYSVIFFLADLQAMRLNPIFIDKKSMYLSLGLIKRAKIDLDNIAAIIDDSELLAQKRSKETIDFILRDFESVQPDFIVQLKQPVTVTFMIGIEKKYQYIAIKSDNPTELKEALAKNKVRF